MVNCSLVPPGEDQNPERVGRGWGEKLVPRGREMVGAAEPAGFSSLFSWEIKWIATSLKSTAAGKSA